MAARPTGGSARTRTAWSPACPTGTRSRRAPSTRRPRRTTRGGRHGPRQAEARPRERRPPRATRPRAAGVDPAGSDMWLEEATGSRLASLRSSDQPGLGSSSPPAWARTPSPRPSSSRGRARSRRGVPVARRHRRWRAHPPRSRHRRGEPAPRRTGPRATPRPPRPRRSRRPHDGARTIRTTTATRATARCRPTAQVRMLTRRELREREEADRLAQQQARPEAAPRVARPDPDRRARRAHPRTAADRRRERAPDHGGQREHARRRLAPGVGLHAGSDESARRPHPRATRTRRRTAPDGAQHRPRHGPRRRARRHLGGVAGGLVGALLLAACSAPLPSASPDTPRSPPAPVLTEAGGNRRARRGRRRARGGERETNDAAQLEGRVTGPALAIRTSQLAVAAPRAAAPTS